MTDTALWLVRWTLAGVAFSTIVIAAQYTLQKVGRAQSLTLCRMAMLARLIAPLLALTPPILTLPGPGPSSAEVESNGSTSSAVKVAPIDNPAPALPSDAQTPSPWGLRNIGVLA